MRVRPLPKRWLIHDITYTEKPVDDGWGNPINPKPITIKNVRFDDSTEFSRDSNQEKILAEGIVFVDATNSSPLVEFKEDSTISVSMNGKVIRDNLKIKKVVPCYYPTRKAIHHYELEVI